jgi:Cys-rich protein (TIGR01571 family)
MPTKNQQATIGGTNATGYAEFSYDYAAATTPLSDFNGGEQTFQADVSIQVESDESKKSNKKGGATSDAPVKLAALAVSNRAAAASTRAGHAPGPIQLGQWSTGMCNCCDFCVPNCCMATFCPCVSVAQIGTRIGMSYANLLIVFGLVTILDLTSYILFVVKARTSEEYYYYSGYRTYYYHDNTVKLNTWGYICIVITVLLLGAYWYIRSKVREHFQLAGNPVNDCCLSFCCSCCSLAQMATHVKSYTPGSCDFGPPDELPAYVE